MRRDDGQQRPWALATPLTVEDLGGRKGETPQNPGRKAPDLEDGWSLGRQGEGAPCLVTLCEHALGQLGSHRGFSRGASRDPQSPRPPLHPRPSRVLVHRPPPPPHRSLKGAPASDSGSRGPGRSRRRSSSFPQHNPSAAGRALVLITPHPLAAGVTSATQALSSSFQKRRLPPTQPLTDGGLCSHRPRLSSSGGCGSRAAGHASAEAGRKCSRPRLPPR